MKLISLLPILFFPLLINSSGNGICDWNDLHTKPETEITKILLKYYRKLHNDPDYWPPPSYVEGTTIGPKTDGSYLSCVRGEWVDKHNQEMCNFDLFESIAESPKYLNFEGDTITISCPSNYFFEHDVNLSEIQLICKSTGWHTVKDEKLVENPIKCDFCDLPSLYTLAKQFNLVVNLPTSDDKNSFPLKCKKNFVLPVPQDSLKATCSSDTWVINWDNNLQSCERKTCDSTELLDADVDVKMTFDLNGKKFFLE